MGSLKIGASLCRPWLLHLALGVQTLALAAVAAWKIRGDAHGSDPMPWSVVFVLVVPVLGLALLQVVFAARSWALPSASRGVGIAFGLGQLVLQGIVLPLPLLWPWAMPGLALALALLAALALVEAPSLPRPRRAA